MKIHLMEAEHFEVAGIVRKACKTREAAVLEAVAMVKILAADHNGEKPATVTAENWEEVIAALQDYHGAAHCYVEIHELELI